MHLQVVHHMTEAIIKFIIIKLMSTIWVLKVDSWASAEHHICIVGIM